MHHVTAHVVWFDDLKRSDVAKVGGKNSSLGEMIQELGRQGVDVPPGFATTSDAYWHFIDENQIRESIGKSIADWTAGKASLSETGQPSASSSSGQTGRLPRPLPSSKPIAVWPTAPVSPTSVSPSAPAPRPKTFRMRALPDSRRHFSTSSGRRNSCRPASAALPRCLPTGRSPIVRRKASTI